MQRRSALASAVRLPLATAMRLIAFAAPCQRPGFDDLGDFGFDIGPAASLEARPFVGGKSRQWGFQRRRRFVDVVSKPAGHGCSTPTRDVLHADNNKLGCAMLSSRVKVPNRGVMFGNRMP